MADCFPQRASGEEAGLGMAGGRGFGEGLCGWWMKPSCRGSRVAAEVGLNDVCLSRRDARRLVCLSGWLRHYDVPLTGSPSPPLFMTWFTSLCIHLFVFYSVSSFTATEHPWPSCTQRPTTGWRGLCSACLPWLIFWPCRERWNNKTPLLLQPTCVMTPRVAWDCHALNDIILDESLLLSPLSLLVVRVDPGGGGMKLLTSVSSPGFFSFFSACDLCLSNKGGSPLTLGRVSQPSPRRCVNRITPGSSQLAFFLHVPTYL